MSRPPVNVGIRGRGETTLGAQFQDEETVKHFKWRVFGGEIGEGRQCRLIARGKELHDPYTMGSYGIEEGSFLHVMIGPEGWAARTSRASNTAAEGRQSQGGGVGFTILCTLTLGMVISAWTLFVVWPEVFTAQATALLLFLTCLQLTLLLPLLKAAVHTAVVACQWRHPHTLAPRSRRRQ